MIGAAAQQVVAGVNPKRAGEEPSRPAGLRHGPVRPWPKPPSTWSVMFIPARCRQGRQLIDAIEAGTKTLVVLTEHIPNRGMSSPSTMRPRAHGTRIVGPNTAGVVTPGEGFVGIMPGHNPNIFQARGGRRDLPLAAASAP